MNFLEPWVFLSSVAGLVAAWLMFRAALTSVRVLRRWDLARATEGQLLLERRLELASTFVRVAFPLSVLSLLLFVLATDKLRQAIRGAMCSYGVLGANDWGFRALFAGVVAVLLLGWLAQTYAFDARVRTMELGRVLAFGTVAVAPVVILAMGAQLKFMAELDLTAVASCCSVQLDTELAGVSGLFQGPRVPSAVGALVLGAVAAGLSLLVSRKVTRAGALAAGLACVFGVPLALAAATFEVAPHVFETPTHLCPFCLFRSDAWGLGYALFGAVLAAGLLGGGLVLSALLSGTGARAEAFAAFARRNLRWQASACVVAIALGVFPVARYAIISGGASLFP
jgi:hypothetical protein